MGISVMICIQGQKRLYICLGILSALKNDIDCMAARNPRGLPLKTGTCHVFQFNNVVLCMFKRKDFIHRIVFSNETIAANLPKCKFGNCLCNMRNNNLVIRNIQFNLTPSLDSFHQLNSDRFKHCKY